MNNSSILSRLRTRIDGISVLSLDVFDTALFRKLSCPADVFVAMERDVKLITGLEDVPFCDLRTRAEREAGHRVRSASDGQETSLGLIYNSLQKQTGWQTEVVRRIMGLEIAVESKFLYARADVLELYLAAREMGKRVIFLSDMYLSSAVIGQFLQKNGFDNPEIYVSCEQGCGKARGLLYKKVQSFIGVPAASILHLGDRFYADYLCARWGGWQAFYVGSLKARALSFLGAGKKKANLGSSVYFGLNRRYAATSREAVFEEAFWRSLGSQIAGPLYFAFASWLLQKAADKNIQRLLLCSRDGYPLLETLEVLKDAWGLKVDCRYFYASRRLFNFARIQRLDDASIDFLLMASPKMKLKDVVIRCGMNPQDHWEFFRSRGFESMDMAITSDAFGRFIAPSYRKHFWEWLFHVERELLDGIARERELAFQYFDEAGVALPGASVVDVGWNATVCRSIQDLMRIKSPGFKLSTLFFGTYDEAERLIDEGGSLESFYFHLGRPPYRHALVDECEELVELFFSAPHGTIVGLRKGDRTEPIYGDLEFDPSQMARLAHIREGARIYVEDAARLLRPGDMAESSLEHLDNLLARLIRHPSRAQAANLGSMPHRQTYGDRGGLRKFAELPQVKGTSTHAIVPLAMAYGEAYWKRGFLAQLTTSQACLVRLIHLFRSVWVAFSSGTLRSSIRWALFGDRGNKKRPSFCRAN